MSCKEKDDPFLASRMSEILYIGIREGAGISLEEIDITEIEVFKVLVEAIEDEEEMDATILLMLISFDHDEDSRQIYIQAIEYTDDGETNFNVQVVEDGREQYDLDVTYYETVDVNQDPDVEVLTYETSTIILSKEDVLHYIDLSKANLENVLKEQFIHQIGIVADAGLEISLDGTNFMTTITYEAMQVLSLSLLDAWRLEHVSTYDGELFYKLYHNETSYVDEGYISFPIYFRSRESVSIYLDSIFLDSDLKSMLSSATFTDSKGNTIFTGSPFITKLTDGMRISFIGTVENEKHIVIYENPESDTNTYMGGFNYTNLQGTNGSIDYYYDIVGAYPYLSSAVKLPETISSANQTKLLDLISQDNYYQGMIRINIWVEGWDAEAYEILERDDFKLNLSFSGR